MKKVGLWGMAALLALAGAACTSERPPLELTPGNGFSVEPQPDIHGSLQLPADGVARQAQLIQAEVTLDNQSGDVAILAVPRACDVQDWVMRDQTGALVMTKGAVECVAQPVQRPLAPGEVLREKVVLYMLPGVLESGRRYVIEYRLWGQPARAEVTVR